VVSRQAVAAVLARSDLTGGERLVALSLASFAGRDNRAWPGTTAGAARAGLGRSRYLEARDALVARGLVVVESTATGRGRASVLSLRFAELGPWWEGDINVDLLEAVVGFSAARGPARLLVATMAALASADGRVEQLSMEQLCAAAGIADRTYRRARQALLASGELVLVSGAGGRGNTNVWLVRDPRCGDGAMPAQVSRRVPPPTGARPFVNSGQVRTVCDEKCPGRTGVSSAKGGQDRTLFEIPAAETPAERAAETPAANARGGREPQNPRIPEHPPSPPEGRTPPDTLVIEQTHVTERGRRRRRMVRVDLDQVRRGLRLPAPGDRADWHRIRDLLKEAVGESTFEIWLAPTELIAVDGERRLLIAVSAATAAWTTTRYGRLLAVCADRVGRGLRFASEPEVRALAVPMSRRQPQHEVAG
jgi:hypothetical protein